MRRWSGPGGPADHGAGRRGANHRASGRCSDDRGRGRANRDDRRGAGRRRGDPDRRSCRSGGALGWRGQPVDGGLPGPPVDEALGAEVGGPERGRGQLAQGVKRAVFAGIVVQEQGFGTVGNTISDNLTTDNAHGIGVGNAVHTNIEGNASLRDETGISLGGFGTVVSRNRLSEDGEGIRLSGAAFALIRRNAISDSQRSGIALVPGLFESNESVQIVHNSSSHNGDDGILISGSGPDIHLSRNSTNRNADLGIEALAFVFDDGGNKAHGNGNPLQCVGVACR